MHHVPDIPQFHPEVYPEDDEDFSRLPQYFPPENLFFLQSPEIRYPR